jgi:hypothetical protein
MTIMQNELRVEHGLLVADIEFVPVADAAPGGPPATAPTTPQRTRLKMSAVCRNGDHEHCDGRRFVKHLPGGDVKLGRCKCRCHQEGS